MTLAIGKEEIFLFLHAIESGVVVLKPRQEPQSVYAGIAVYDASNGWAIAVFNDANEWDYIEWISADDGRRVDFFCMEEQDSDLENYAPSNEIAWRRYGIPGYLQNRCRQCSALITPDRNSRYLCQDCIS